MHEPDLELASDGFREVQVRVLDQARVSRIANLNFKDVTPETRPGLMLWKSGPR